MRSTTASPRCGSCRGDLPVEGRILFTRRGRFPKGLPRWTLMVDSLHTEFPLPDSEAAQSWVDQYRETWQRLQRQCLAQPVAPAAQLPG